MRYEVLRATWEEIGDGENGPRLAERHEYVESFETRAEAEAFVASRPTDTLFVEDTMGRMNDFETWMVNK